MNTEVQRTNSTTRRAEELPPRRAGAAAADALISALGGEPRATEGGITESLAMMNGEAADAVIGNQSLVMQQAALRSQHADKVDLLYRSFLTRNPSRAEKQTCAKVFDLRMDISDIAWALLNSREFMFIQ